MLINSDTFYEWNSSIHNSIVFILISLSPLIFFLSLDKLVFLKREICTLFYDVIVIAPNQKRKNLFCDAIKKSLSHKFTNRISSSFIFDFISLFLSMPPSAGIRTNKHTHTVSSCCELFLDDHGNECEYFKKIKRILSIEPRAIHILLLFFKGH